MSERILKALMQLFAIVAKVNLNDDEIRADQSSRLIVKLFLQQDLPSELIDKYLKIFDEFIKERHSSTRKKDGTRKRTSVNSVKVLRICTQINEELEQRQKVIVLIRILEFIFADPEHSEKELEFAATVADTFNIESKEYEEIFHFVESASKKIFEQENQLIICSDKKQEESKNKCLHSEGINGKVIILRVQSVKTYFVRYFGNQELLLNGQLLPPSVIKVFRQGSSLKNSKINPIFYSDVVTQFLSEENTEKILFTAEKSNMNLKLDTKGYMKSPLKKNLVN